MTTSTKYYQKLLTLATEISLARAKNIYKSVYEDWDDYVSIGDEAVLLDFGFKYSNLNNSILYAKDLTGVEWQAWLKEEEGLTAPVLFSIINSMGSTSQRKPMLYSHFRKIFRDG